MPTVRIPRPDLLMTSVAREGLASPIVTVICGAVIATFHVDGKVVTPLSVRLLVPLKTCVPVPLPSSPKTTLLEIVKAPPETRVVLFAIVKVPTPTGPEVGTSSKPLPVLLAPITNPPAETVTPPAKVLWPASCRRPLPVLVMPPFWIVELMISPACQGATSMPLTSEAPTLME